MTTIDITLKGKGVKQKEFNIPMFEFMKLKVQSLNIVYGFLLGTESNEWLKEAENG